MAWKLPENRQISRGASLVFTNRDSLDAGDDRNNIVSPPDGETIGDGFTVRLKWTGERYNIAIADEDSVKVVCDANHPQGGGPLNRSLEPGDWIDIAGLRLRLKRKDKSGLIVNRPEGTKGVSLHVKGLGVKCRKKGSLKEKTNILSNVSFEIEPGSFVGVLGPSGCGKSTLFERIVGFSTRNEWLGCIKFIEAIAKPRRCEVL